MTTLADLKVFDIAGAEVTVWAFKKPRSNGGHRFVGRWIGITDGLADKLRATVAESLIGIEETRDYDVLAQTNEASALTIEADETDTHLIAARIPIYQVRIKQSFDRWDIARIQ